jgi:hypothetical protein
MLCHVCIGVLQYRQNILVPGTIDDEEVYFEDSEDSEHSNDDEKGCISNQSQARDTDKLPRPTRVKCGHQRTSTDLALSAAAGCQICQPFWDRCSSTEKEHIHITEEKIALEAASTMNDQQSKHASQYEFLSTATIIITNHNTIGATLDIKYNHHKAWNSFTWRYWSVYVLKPGMCMRQHL